MAKIFADRREAGQLLAKELSSYFNRLNAMVLAIPRGGVVVGGEVARALKLPLDVIVTKKIGAPGNEELAIGAVAEDGEPIYDQDLVSRLGIGKKQLSWLSKQVFQKIKDYITNFRGGRALGVADRVVIVVDDGVATGATIQAALAWLRSKHPKEVILAVPTGAADSMRKLEQMADRTVCLDKPEWFAAVGQFYREFGQVSDEEVKRIVVTN